MKVLFWGEYFLPAIGGAEIFLSQLLPALVGRGIECHLVTNLHSSKLPNHEIWNGVSVHRLNFREAILGNLQAFAEIRRQLSSIYGQVKPDLIHVHTTGPSLFFELQTHRHFDIPRFLTIHAFFSYPPKDDGYLRKFLPQVTFLSGVSQQILDMALPLFSAPPPHRLIYNGVEPPPASALKTDANDEVILFLGRLSPEKGVDLAIRAFQRLSQKRPDARMLVAGEGVARAELETLTASLELDQKVRFLGAVPPRDVYEVIAQSRFLVLPSRFDEGLPLSALQAALLGKPMIAARRGGTPEFVRDGKTGLLFEEEDWVGLASRMDELLSDTELCEELGQNAAKLALEHFDFTAMVDQYEQIYRQLAG